MTKTRHFFDPNKLAAVCHPGEILEEKLQELGMSVKEFSIRVSKPEKTIIAVIKGKSSITPDMAVAFEMVTKIPAHMWLKHQRSFDEYISRKKREERVDDGMKWARKFPYEEIKGLGWFDNLCTTSCAPMNKVDLLCAFFAVSSPKGWEDFYLNKKLRIAFRITLSESCDPYALSAWLRQGEIQAQHIKIDQKYSSKLLRHCLEELANLRQSKVFLDDEVLMGLLCRAGVILIRTTTLTSAPVKGCTRYINGIPCIQLAMLFNSEQDFWSTLYHEIAHILLHGKKDIFMENVNYGSKDPLKESEADKFAEFWMNKSEPLIS